MNKERQQQENFLTKTILHACVYFTTISLVLIFLGLLRNQNGIHPVALLLCIPFSYLFALANVQFKYAPYKTAWRLLIHAVLVLGSLYGFVYWPNRLPEKSAAVHFGFFLGFLVIYAIIMAVVLGIRARIVGVSREATQYKSLYGQKEQQKSTQAKQPAKNKKQDDYQSVFKKK